IVLYGSPYGRDWLQRHCPKHLPWFFSYGQTPSAQALAMDAVFGKETNPSAQLLGFI
ncbi:MAG: beta-glucosidase, partial [Spirulina sp. SIO3F2]|nr:beta-glucosidase [Spirulina sp. SIO3F2]